MHSPSPSTFLVVFITISALFSQSINADTIYAWGSNDYGQLGLGSLMDPVREPTAVSFFDSLTVTDIQIAASYSFITTAEGSTNNVYASGNNYFGCLGLNITGSLNSSYTSTPIANPALTNCTVVASKRHANAVCKTSAYGWGTWAGNVFGATTGVWPKVHKALYPFPNTVASVSVVEDGTFVSLENGVVYSAGNGTYGKLALGSDTDQAKLTQVNFFNSVPVQTIYNSQSFHSCAVAKNGSLFCWGNNDQGQLGLGANADAFVEIPTLVQGIEDGEYWISQVSFGAEHTLALSCGGAVLAWGSHNYGVLGDGIADNTSIPSVTVVQGLQGKNIVEIVTSANSNFARSSDGTWYTWGAGYGGILGTTSDVNVAVPVVSSLFTTLNINHIVSGSSARSAFGYNVPNVFTTTQCQFTLVDECTAGTANCAPNNSICTDTDRSFKCSCEAGFNGDPTVACVDIDECAIKTDLCDVNSQCVNTIGSYTCVCNANYHGDGYEAGATIPNFSGPTQGCILNVDECLNSTLNDCSSFADCTDTIWAYNCTCKSGFTGDGVTCKDINECANRFNPPCGSNSVCTNTNGSYECNCQSGFQSPNNTYCTDIDECNSTTVANPCSPNATCLNSIGSYSCGCNDGFTGNGTSCTPAGTSSSSATVATTSTASSTGVSVENGTSTTSASNSSSTGEGSTTGDDSNSASVTSGSGSTLGVQTLGQTSTIGGTSSTSTSSSGPGAVSDLNAAAPTNSESNAEEKKILVGVFVGFIGLVIVVVAIIVIVVVRRRKQRHMWA